MFFILGIKDALLLANQTILKSCKVSKYSWFSENFSFALYAFSNDSSFWKWQYLWQEQKIYIGKTLPAKVEKFLNVKNSVYRKLLNLELFHSHHILMVWERIWSYKRDQNIEVYRKVVRVTSTNLFTKISLEKTFETKSRNQVKLDRTKKR